MRPIAFLLSSVLFCTLGTSAIADQPRLVIDTGGHTAKIHDVIFTHDGSHLVSAGQDKVVRVWDVHTGQTVRIIRGEIGDGPAGKIYAAALSLDDRYLAVGGRLAGGHKQDITAIRVHDFRDGAVLGLLRGHEDVVSDLAFSPDGYRLASASADKTVRIWDVDNGGQLRVLEGHTDFVQAVAFSPAGNRLVSASADGTLRLWGTAQGTLIRVMEGHEGAVLSVTFSPDGRYIASGGDDKTVRVWNAQTGEHVKILAQQDTTIVSLTFSRDGRRLLISPGWGGGYVCTLLSVPSGEVLVRFRAHTNVVLATAISPDGKVAATAGGDDKEIYLWDTQTGQRLRKLAGQGHVVWSVGFGRDGRSIAYGNEFNHLEADHHLGALQKVIHLKANGYDEIAPGGKVKDPSAYFRAFDRHGDHGVRTRDGRYGYQSVLQVLRAGEVLYEIERNLASGARHRSYTFTHRGKYIASGGSGGVLTVYRSDTGEQLRDFVGHTGAVFTVAVSPDDRTLISGSADQTIRLWDIESGKNLLTFFVGSDGEWVAWTSQGYYTSSLKGDKYIGWHVNRGVEWAAEYYGVERFQKTLYRSDVVAEYMEARDIWLALERANRKRGVEDALESVDASPDIRNMLPPLIHVISPARPENVVQEPTVRVSAVVLSNTLPISDVRILLNGVQIAGQPAGKPKGGDPFKRIVELEIPLDKGSNTLSVIAFHEKASSQPEIRKITYEPRRGEPQDLRPRLLVLAVGVSDYRDETLRLDYAADDARAVVKLFERQQGVIFREVITRSLPDEQATRAAIVKGLNWLEREGTQNDIRILFLSGHGVLDNRDNFFFLPYDHEPGDEPNVTGLSRSALLDRLSDLPGKVILMVDACRAGAVAAEKRKGTVDFTRVIKALNSQYGGLVTFAASTGKEVSVEREEWGHGAFTQALIEGLSGKADGFGGKTDGVVYIHELGSWIIERVKALTEGRQHAIYDPPSNLPSFPLFTLG